ncbi:MAG: extracellular catalytic domain type 1 short-chain-length polyhydroxyalkanoate depolymerase [Gemmatirosa sp.]
MRRVGVIVALATGAGLAGGGGTSPAAAQSPAASAGQVTYGAWGDSALPRRWRLYTPARRADAKPAPLLVLLHGCTQDVDDMARGTRMDEVAERHGLVVLYPEQPAGANALRCWNWFEPAHQRRDAGEPALLAALVARVAAEHGVDPARVHVAGMSAGGAMALLLASGYPERFASATSASGMPVGAVTGAANAWQVMRAGASAEQSAPEAVRERMGDRARAVPLLVLHGGADATVVPVNGRRAAEQWAAAIGATARGPQQVAAAGATRGWQHLRWRGADDRDLVEYVEIAGLGHAWSGGSTTGTYTDAQGPAASELLAAFIARHALPAGRGK